MLGALLGSSQHIRINSLYLSNPVTFCRPRAAGGLGKILVPKDSQLIGKMLSNANSADPAKKTLQPTGYFRVRKEDRVSYCQVKTGGETDLGAVGYMREFGATCLAEVKDDWPTGDWFPIFYLPWQGNQTIRMTLKEPGNWTGAPVEHFITSAVDGCSVVVEGSQANPTVYHLNNMGGGAPPLGGTLAQNQAYWNPKKNTMEARFQAARSPKSVRQAAHMPGAAPVLGAKGVHALDYLDMTEAQRGNYENRVNIQDAFQEAKNKAPDALSWIYTGSDYKPFGTVFGWKQAGNWTFYYQRRATMWYKYRATFANKPAAEYVISRQMAWHLDEFWPNGSGVAVAKVLVP